MIDQFLDKLTDWTTDRGRDLIFTLLFVIIALKLAKHFVRVLGRSFERSKIDKSVSGFLQSLIKWALYTVVLITAASMLGFQVTSLVTLLGTAGLAVGLGLQGSLANLAGGFLILTMKPFKVGDYIIENDKGCEGTVISIDIFYTKLRTIDNRIVIIPNGNITNCSLVNLSAEGVRRVNTVIPVAYASDLALVRSTLLSCVSRNSFVSRDETPEIFVKSFGDSAIEMGVRFNVKNDDFWKASWEFNETVKNEFDAKGIVIPFKQVEVTMKDK